MATLTEMVEEEAARAEAEESEEEEESEEPELEPEPEPEPEEPEAFAAIGEKEIKQAQRAIGAQRKKLAGIFGEAAVAHDCPLCAAMGFLPELPPPGTTFSIEPSEGGYEFVAQAPRQEPPYVQAPDKEACPWCDAYGFVLSGSKFEHARVTSCFKCSGNGWVTKPVEGQPPTVSDFTIAAVTTPSSPAGPELPDDAWGRPYGHKHWGVHPKDIPG